MKLPSWVDAITFIQDNETRELTVEICSWKRVHLTVALSAEAFNIETLKIMLRTLAHNMIDNEFPDCMPGFYTRQANATVTGEPLHPTDEKLLARMKELSLPDNWPDVA